MREKVLEILQDMPATRDLPLLPDYAEHEETYRSLAHTRDHYAGIPIQGLREEDDEEEEDGEESSEDEEMKEFREKIRRKNEFLDECRRKWKEQG